jgi:hypothetical protein
MKTFQPGVQGMNEKDIVTYLKVSGERAGRLYPVLLDRHGNIIDGMHRLTADKKWPKITIENIETEEQRLIARIISNVCRRHIPAKEKREMLGRLGEIYQKEGVEQGKIAYKIAEKTGMSYTWVMKYLPNQFKDDVKSESARATRRVAKDPKPHVVSFELKEPPQGVVAVKAYGNTDFVNIMLEKQFYGQLEETAKKLETTPDKLIYNAILLIIKSLNIT